MAMRRNKSSGFTLIELLVVVSIIALLVSILLPALGRARTQVKSVVCLTNVRNTALSTQVYASDNDGYLPGTKHNWARDYQHLAHVNYTSFSGPDEGKYDGPTGVGLLYVGDYLIDFEAFYCPGRRTNTDIYRGQFINDNNAEKWTPLDGFVQCSYYYATTNTDPESGLSFRNWHRTDRTHPSKPITFEVCVSDFDFGGNTIPVGSGEHRHGLGYNFAFFDGSAEWMPDPLNYLEQTYYKRDIYPAAYNDSNMIYYIMTEFIGGWRNHHEY